MHYQEIENIITEDDTIINWRVRRGQAQLRCPKCDLFFDIPKDIKIDSQGYCSSSIYHFCEDIYDGEENNDFWTVLAHLVGWE